MNSPEIDCNHEFNHGICDLCDYDCEHDELDDRICLDCGEFIPKEVDADWLYEAHSKSED